MKKDKNNTLIIVIVVGILFLAGFAYVMLFKNNGNPVPNQLFTTNFDSGSLGEWKEISTNNYEMKFREDFPGCSTNQGAYDQCTSWMFFQYKGKAGDIVTFKFTNFIYASSSYWNAADTRAYVSCNINDQNNWTPTGTKTLLANTGTTVTKSVKLSMTLPCDNPYIASFIPYQVSFREKVISELKANKNVDVDVIGKSRLDQNIYRVTITNPSVSDNNKKIIVVNSGLHSSETYGDFIVEGMVRAAMKDDEWLKKYIIYWYPVSNPVGRFKGYGRYDDLGNDPNRVWSNNKNPEVKIIKDDIIKTVGPLESRVILGIDSHGNGGTTGTSYAMTCETTQYANNLKTYSVFKSITGGRCPTTGSPNPSAVGTTGASFYGAYFPKAITYTSEHVQRPANSYNNLMLQGDGWFKSIKATWN